MTIAERIARIAHTGQVDKQGVDYIKHPERVAAAVAPDYQEVAWLHDVLEDCPAFREEVHGTFGSDTLAALELLTRRSGEVYDRFIERIANSYNVCAITVKLADLWDNLRPGCTETRARRYIRAIGVLNHAIEPLRASGEAICTLCNRAYREHPFTEDRSWDGHPFLHRLCSGRTVKL